MKSAKQRPGATKINVLLVEDNAVEAELTKVLLAGNSLCQFTARVAPTLAAALEAVRTGPVDVVVLDLGLPDSFGLATFDQLQAAAPELPVIIYTGLGDAEVAVEAVQRGAQDCLTKGQADGDLLARAIRHAVERQRIELALERERDLFRALMENIPDSIYFKDLKSRFLRSSRSQTEMFGFKNPEDIVGKTDFDMFKEDHARRAFEDEQEIIRTGKPLVGKVEKETLADGRLRWALTTKMPFRDKQWRIIGTFGISKNLTELKLMEETLENERNLLRSLIDALPDHIYVKDADCRFVLCNQAVSRFFKLGSPEEVHGKSDFDFLPRRLAQQFHEEEQALLRGETPSVHRETEFGEQDGRTHWVITTKVLLRDGHGRIIGLVGINRDITERKQVEEQLHQINLELARSQKETLVANAELKAAQTRLIQAEKLESIGRLAAGVAHEVKNPLATLLMGLDYLAEKFRESGEDVAITIAEMEEAIKRADDIIHGLQDFSASPQLDTEETNLNSVIEQSLLLTYHELRHKRIHVIKHFAPDLPKLPLDRRRIEQVFINVFTNAIMAMPVDGELCLVALAQQEADGRVKVTVRVEDNGPGVPAEILPRVFDPFFSTKPTSMGQGLGLALARNILDLHGGKIEMSNRPEGGACVTLTLYA
ncbi:MAG: PAS domain S-box protein [Verrucomicrobia bacterium]|nr:PAS domain S-box protein [Verrucomicrobiota bacterium]